MLRRREILAGAAALGALAGCASPGITPGVSAPLRRIGFASCADQTKPQPIWGTVIADRPDLFVFGGDNVYCEMPYSLAKLRRAYALAAACEPLARLGTPSPTSPSGTTMTSA